MRLLMGFEEFLKDGTIRKRSPNPSRAKSLVEEVEGRKKFLGDMLGKIGISDSNANYFIENSYDILIELLRARLLLDGFDSSGRGAHEAEVAYMRRLGFSEPEVRFMNSLRYFRNGIKYYGRRFNAEYGKKVIAFMERVSPKLKSSFGKFG